MLIEIIQNQSQISISNISISTDGTHHVFKGSPLYERRFSMVMSFHEPGIAAVQDDSGAFYIDKLGRSIFGRTYMKAFGFYQGIAAGSDRTGWYHIDLNGNPAYETRFHWVGNFQEGLSTVRDDKDRYFHIHQDGSRAYSESYVYVGDFKYGIAVVYDDEGFAHHVKRDGAKFHGQRYNELGVFHKGFAVAKDEKGYFHINHHGTAIYEARWLWCEPFYNGIALVKSPDGMLCLIDETGESSPLHQKICSDCNNGKIEGVG